MKKITLLLMLFGLGFISKVTAQHKTVIYGNLGVENVNISIVNTQYGTSTDAKGHYELPLYDCTKPVNLYYTCIGYQDTLVRLTPKLLQRDSTNISFKMRKMRYDLQEVGVSASRDFYRSKTNRNIADMVFLDGSIYLLENKPKASSLVVLNTDGEEQARKDYDRLFEKLYLDAFNDIILVGQDSCLQVYLDSGKNILPVSTFSREDYRELLKIVCEFNGAYIIKALVHDKGHFWLKYNHGKSQDFYYVMKDNTEGGAHYLCSFLDTLGYCICQSQWMSIENEYHQLVEDPVNDIIYNGLWDGNLVRLILTESLEMKVQWYCSILAKKEYHISHLIFHDFMQFVDLNDREIMEIGTDFKITSRRPLQITANEKHFTNEFLKDDATGKTYGLFVDNGMNYIGLYDPQAGTVGMGQKASKKIYPKVFKVYGGYAYSVYFDSGSNRGVINRVKID